MLPTLQVDSLGKNYGSTKALDGLSLTISGGETVGILGPNGSGKTTFLSLILGIKSLSAGKFSWFGEPANRIVNSKIGSLLEVPYYYPYLSVEKNLKISAFIKGCNLDDIPKVLRAVKLADRKKTPCHALSLGLKQRLAIAQALLGNPDVLIFDEPTNGLDPEGIADVRQLIREQSQLGKTIILASHNLDEVQRVCSHAVILNKGKGIAQGKVNDLLSINQLAIINTLQVNELSSVLREVAGCKVIEQNNFGFVLTFDPTVNVTDFSALLSARGILLNKFEVRKSTLEEFFLTLTKSKKH